MNAWRLNSIPHIHFHVVVLRNKNNFAFNNVWVMVKIIYIYIKVKVKLSLFFVTEHHAMKAYWGSGGIHPRILDLGTRWR